MSNQTRDIHVFQGILSKKGIRSEISADNLVSNSGKKEFTLSIENHFHLISSDPIKLASLVQSKLGLNRRIFARNCEVKKINKEMAEEFLATYHLMNATQSGSNYGLFYKNELLAVTSFSKGRKMNRLTEDQRSFELIRFCCKDGISVTGGLTKLVKNFCREKMAGDVMTYVDKQFSEGESFIKAGFVKHSETERNVKLVYTP